MFHSLGAREKLPLISTSEDRVGTRDPAVLIGESPEAWLVRLFWLGVTR